MPKYVISSTLKDPEWTNTTVLDGDPVEAVRRLKEEQDGTIAVHGSGMVAQMLLEHDLVDQLNLMVYPVVLGKGRRLFGETSAKKTLELAESRTYDGSVLVLVYRRAAGYRSRSSSAVSSAAGTASSRSSGIGSPLSTDLPYVPAASRSSARPTAASCSRRSSSRPSSSSSW